MPRWLQELREAAGMSMDALWLKCGVSRDMISRIESGESIPTLHVANEGKSRLVKKFVPISPFHLTRP